MLWPIVVPIVVVVALIAAGVRIVNQYEHGIIFRLGRYAGTRKPGQNLIIPMVDVNGSPFPYPIESKGFKMLLALQQKAEGIELTVQKHSSLDRDMLIMTAQVFPQINVLWIGCLVMVIGTVMAIRHRYKIARKK